MKLLNSFALFIICCTNVYATGDPSTWVPYDGAGSLDNAALNLVVKIDGVTVTSGKVAIKNANGDIRGSANYGQIDPFNSGFAITVFQPTATTEGPYTLHYSSDDTTVIDLSPGYTWSSTATSQESSGTTPASPTATDCLEPATAGYDFSGVSGSIAEASFSITGVACDTGFSGTATATKCAAAGQDYSVSGCTQDPTNVDCLGTWSAYSVCSGGSQSRTFTETTAQSGNGAACPTSPQSQSCTGDVGDSCSQDSHCTDGNCDGGTCADPVTIVTQTLDLQVGWNWKTVSIQLSDMTIASVLTSPEDGDRVLCQDSDSTYYSGYGWYSPSGLSEFTVGQGCKIKVATSKSIVLQGTVKESVDYNLNTGYTWVSISHDPPSLSIDQFLAGTFVNGDKIKVDASTELTYDGSAWSSAHNFALGDTIKVMKMTGGSFTHST